MIISFVVTLMCGLKIIEVILFMTLLSSLTLKVTSSYSKLNTNLYLSLYDKVYLQSQISTGSLFYLPSNFAYDFTLMASVAISNSLSLGFSLRTGLADSFAETFFSNRYDYSVFINWEYLL